MGEGRVCGYGVAHSPVRAMIETARPLSFVDSRWAGQIRRWGEAAAGLLTATQPLLTTSLTPATDAHMAVVTVALDPLLTSKYS